MTRRLLSCALAAAILAGPIAAQQRFTSRVEGVRVDVLVTDGSRRVGNLRADDFELRDNGVLQRITRVDLEPQTPLSVICVSVTLTITLLLLSVGSFFRAPSICVFIWSASEDWPAVEDCATPLCALLLGLVLVLMPVLELWPAAVEG